MIERLLNLNGRQTKGSLHNREVVEKFRKKGVCCRRLPHFDNITNVLHWDPCKPNVLHQDEAAVQAKRKAKEGEADTRNKVVHKILWQ